ncbi:hypothetical protein DICPUDRAFT_148988 [Dictyostelium purpureum]|uniref:ABC transporter C family protein n=1 Tax=Dictyostelium purpureum TaxID=5786 RepID=F0ZCI6_DICPU|nr:uncharacterized protein DICPUDRAFT_148988 [Dictyostelium purpureum]EGC38375.1 hypothetical protein DICPUDRAFT_148988 [Dictyostelium purpureum]|eukprot:XP_003285132.1 hypothetical protein DICPUDRAFT_148988 [Dictyostelium purpureum]
MKYQNLEDKEYTSNDNSSITSSDNESDEHQKINDGVELEEINLGDNGIGGNIVNNVSFNYSTNNNDSGNSSDGDYNISNNNSNNNYENIKVINEQQELNNDLQDYGSEKEDLLDQVKKKGFGGLKSPEEHANIFSKLTYLWADKFVYYCFKNVLQLDDIWDLASFDTSHYLYKTMEKNWNEQLASGKKPSFFKASWKSFGKYFMLSWVFYGLNVISQFIGPQILQRIVKYVQGTTDLGENWGYYYSIILFTNAMIGSVFLYQSSMISARTGNRLKSIMVLFVYKKSLKLSNSSRNKKSNGEIVNLMSNDAQRLLEIFQFVNIALFALPMIGVAMVLLYQCLGWPSFITLAVMGLTLPFNSLQGSKLSKFRRKLVQFTDQRVKVTNEMFQAIKTIKLYSWEDSFLKRVLEKRENEMKFLQSFVRFRYSLVIVITSLPTVVSILMFTVYYLVNKELPAAKIFAAVAYLNILRVPFNFLPHCYNLYIQFKVSLDRVVSFLGLEEIEPRQSDTCLYVNKDLENESDEIIKSKPKDLLPENKEKGIFISGGTFSWSSLTQQQQQQQQAVLSIKDESKQSLTKNDSLNEENQGKPKKPSKFKDVINKIPFFAKHQFDDGGERSKSKSVDTNFNLKDISLQIKGNGTLLMVIGGVGSGKSSICQAVLGEMEILKGSLLVNGSIAYVSQQSWIMNATLRDNILFGKEYDEKKYQNVLDVCALRPDIALFPQGDMVEIGERGINLSGGQKQRVAIARSVYCDADIYVLDDVLSAVDAHVGKHLFHKCIRGALKDKIVILATNQINYAPYSTETIILKQGEIEERGTFQQLIESNSDPSDKSKFSNLLKQFSVSDQEQNEKEINQDEEVQDEKVEINNNKDGDGSLIKAEEIEEGSVSFRHYLYYFTVGGKYLFLCALIGFFIDTSTQTFTNWWLSSWSSAHYGKDSSLTGSQFLGIFVGIGVTSIVLVATRIVLFYEYTLGASREIHLKLFKSMIKAPMSFFDTTPLGRILNRFTRDTDIIDMLMTQSVSQFLNFSTNVLAILVVISIITPILLAPLTPIIIIFYFLQYFYRSTSIQVQRLESVSRSPIFSHFSETLYGVITLRAYRKEKENELLNQKLLDNNNKCYLTLQAMNQWLGLRLNLLGNLVMFFSCLFIILNKDSISIASVGLSLSYTLSLTTNLNKATVQVADTETKMNSVERISHYTKVPSEAPQIIENNRPPSHWPSKGSIVFKNVFMSYREGLPAVLKGISFQINPGEKIGIAGRTGSGKSSTLLALFRLVELSSGSIFIDDIDVSTIGLKDLRHNLSLIPQDPWMFNGTLRENLDPLSEYSDHDLWEVLKDIQLYDVVREMNGDSGLDSRVNEGGENWSQGQRQLICLGRALLKRPRILVLDEATASVDTHTDQLIQKCIREKFQHCTILTIAHRINTILDSDRIMILDSGTISEFDKPSKLIQNESSLLNFLINETGEHNSKLLRSMIKY